MNNNPFEKFAKEIFREAHRKLSERMKARRIERSRRQLIATTKERNQRIDQVLPVTKKSTKRRRLLNEKKNNERLIASFEAINVESDSQKWF